MSRQIEGRFTVSLSIALGCVEEQVTIVLGGKGRPSGGRHGAKEEE